MILVLAHSCTFSIIGIRQAIQVIILEIITSKYVVLATLPMKATDIAVVTRMSGLSLITEALTEARGLDGLQPASYIILLTDVSCTSASTDVNQLAHVIVSIRGDDSFGATSLQTYGR